MFCTLGIVFGGPEAVTPDKPNSGRVWSSDTDGRLGVQSGETAVCLSSAFIVSSDVVLSNLPMRKSMNLD